MIEITAKEVTPTNRRKLPQGLLILAVILLAALAAALLEFTLWQWRKTTGAAGLDNRGRISAKSNPPF